MITAIMLDDSVVVMISDAARECQYEVSVPLVAPSQIERSTGTLRAPEATVDLPADLVEHLTTAVAADSDSFVIGLMIHTFTRTATAVGPFDDSYTATTWWSQPYNRLARDIQTLFLLVPATTDER